MSGVPLAMPNAVRMQEQSSRRRDQNFTSSAKFKRVSDVSRSGRKFGTKDPGAPVFPPTGVTPPGPAKYGTLECR
jgi:hypothetical protein